MHTTAAVAAAASSAHEHVDEQANRQQIWVCNASAGAWRKLEAAGSVPQPRSYHAAAAVAGRLYVFGGCGSDGRLNELHAYDPAGNEWRQLPASNAVPVRGAGGQTNKNFSIMY
jgi:N-acetylneuraminic acid mutarotase